MNSNKEIINFVTGGTGYVGTRLVHKLLEQGESVYALALSEQEKVGFPEHPKLHFVMGNVLNVESLEKGLKNCNRVYHLAGYARNFAKEDKVFFDINVTGTLNIVEASLKVGGIEKIVITSTIVTFGPTKSDQVSNESLPRSTPDFFTAYEASKAEAEKQLEKYYAKIPIVIVNPARVFGPGKLTEGNSVSKMMADFLAGKFPFLLGSGEHIGNYVFVEDLVQGHILAMQKGKSGEKYILGGENISLKNLFRLTAKIAKKKYWQISIPAFLILGFSYIELWRAKYTSHYPLITPGWVKTFLAHWSYSTQKAENELGYQVTPLKEALTKTIQWIRESGW